MTRPSDLFVSVEVFRHMRTFEELNYFWMQLSYFWRQLSPDQSTLHQPVPHRGESVESALRRQRRTPKEGRGAHKFDRICSICSSFAKKRLTSLERPVDQMGNTRYQ